MSGRGSWEPVTGENLPRHLDLAAGPLGRCDECGRSTWTQDGVGGKCWMPQPNGMRCAGTLQPVEPIGPP